MPSNLISLIVALEFLESSRRELCHKYKDNYMNCVKNKKNNFQDCYILHMEKFENCMKTHKIIEKDKNDS